MIDIVERLRDRNEYHQHAPLYNEAADEIERLRKALREITQLMGEISRCGNLANHITASGSLTSPQRAVSGVCVGEVV
jgi:hypothetical protein